MPSNATSPEKSDIADLDIEDLEKGEGGSNSEQDVAVQRTNSQIVYTDIGMNVIMSPFEYVIMSVRRQRWST